MQLAVIQELARYWATDYDWRRCEAKLNALPHFINIPAAVTVFPKEFYQAPRSWAQRAYPKLIYFNEVDRGCHFAAWQEPALFTAKVRAAFRSLR